MERLTNNWALETNYNKTIDGFSPNIIKIIKKHLEIIEKKYNVLLPEQEINIIASILLEK
ncbi:PRD domain-containing protein [Anaerobranca californiensis DSM 14826]|jgi:transcriptional regulatory protein LevR|uniref:PRD domain-containing protein n=2 Tax=Anaerobranca TaxID=42447 RepID=A0A1M6QVE2_9FIRM|nr:PRD domain-containing protein [Anaerobranca californiensis DSM 14826]